MFGGPVDPEPGSRPGLSRPLAYRYSAGLKGVGVALDSVLCNHGGPPKPGLPDLVSSQSDY